jgi:hypothetical protein
MVETVAVPEPVVVAVALEVGTNNGSIAQLDADKVSENGLEVEVSVPTEATYSKHKNLKPELAVALRLSVSPVV